MEQKRDNHVLAYTTLRIFLGINLFAHGLVRIPKVSGFSTWMVEHFQQTFIPSMLVKSFGYSLPFFELIIGSALIVGLFTRKILIFGALLLAFLIFGSCLTEKWEWASFQMVYGLYYFILLYLLDFNEKSIDHVRLRSETTQ